MKIFIDSREYQQGPVVVTHVLNKDECGVAYVGEMFGQLCYREKFHGLPKTTGISHVFMLSSKIHRDLRLPNNVQVDFDVYLEDDRVIEVNTYHRATIEAALKYAPKKDVRTAFRASRGRL